jgi:hypothetical protein
LHTGDGADSSLEWSLRIAGSVADALLAQGISVAMQLGQEVQLIGTNRLDRVKLMDWLALFDAREESLNPPREKSSAVRKQKDSLSIQVTTDRGTVRAKRRIVLVADAFGARNSSDLAPNDWIVVTSPIGVPEQVLRAWKAGCAKETCRDV